MLDIKFVRENPEAVRENLRKRGIPEKIEELDRLLSLDSKWREALVEADRLRRSRNEITQTIADAHKRGRDLADLMRQAETIPRKIKELEAGMASDMAGSVDRRFQTLSDQLHKETQLQAEAMLKIAEVLGEQIDRLSIRVDEGVGNDIQIVVDRMSDAIRAMSTVRRESA